MKTIVLIFGILWGAYIPVSDFSTTSYPEPGSFHFPGNSWELEKESEGIKVYTRLNESSDFRDVRLELKIDASIECVYKAVWNKNDLYKWVYNCSNSYFLRVVKNETIHYQVVDLPWPATDRDLVVKTKIDISEDFSKVKFIAHSVPDYIPEKEGLVRISNSTALWELIRNPDNSTSVTFESSLDPSGSIPAWIVNMAVTDGPINSMKNLREWVKGCL